MGQCLVDSPTMLSRIAVAFLLFTASCHAGLLGAGTGPGSCKAAPFRALVVDHPVGCPAHQPCCSEYGYCHGRDAWQAGNFRDCNGVSNGQPLPADAINAETSAAAAGDARGLPLLGVPTVGAGAPGAGGFSAGRAGAGGFGAGGFGAGAGAGGFGAGAGAGGFGAGGSGASSYPYNVPGYPF